MAEWKTRLLVVHLCLLLSTGSSWSSTRHDLKKQKLQDDELAIKDVVRTRRLAESGGVPQSNVDN